MDFKNMGAKKVCIVTDGNVAKLNAMKQAVEGLSKEGVDFTVYEKTMVEPKDSSIREAIDFSKSQQPDAFLAVGGGSVRRPSFAHIQQRSSSGCLGHRHGQAHESLYQFSRQRVPRLC